MFPRWVFPSVRKRRGRAECVGQAVRLLCPLSMSHRRSLRTIPSAPTYAESVKLTPIHYRQPWQWQDASTCASGRRCKRPTSSQPTIASPHESVRLPLVEATRKGLPVTTRALRVRTRIIAFRWSRLGVSSHNCDFLRHRISLRRRYGHGSGDRSPPGAKSITHLCFLLSRVWPTLSVLTERC